MDFSKLCTPAYIYFVISLIFLILFSFLKNFNIMNIIINIIYIILWSLFLNFLCNMGYSIIAWLILVLPFFVLI